MVLGLGYGLLIGTVTVDENLSNLCFKVGLTEGDYCKINMYMYGIMLNVMFHFNHST